MTPNRILVLSPHTDDAELGCGGTIARFAGRAQIVILTLSDLSDDVLAEEARAASLELGVDLDCRHFQHRRFDEQRQEILDLFIEYREERDPDWVLLPSAHDMHQDHAVVYAEGLRAFKHSTVLAYELPWNHLTFRTQGFVPFHGEHLHRKLAALAKYESQGERIYFDSEFITSLARVRGTQIGEQYAEAFEVVRARW